MSSTSTTWSTQGNTKAGATVTSTDSLTTGTLTADTLQLASNIIKASDGDTAITLDTSSNALIAGGLTSTTLLTATAGIKLGNNIIYASDGGTAITLDTSDNVTIGGDLTVNGNDIEFGNGAIIENSSNSAILAFTTETIYQFKSTSGNDLTMIFDADAGEDNSDRWSMKFADGGNFTLSSYATDEWVTALQFTNTSDATIGGDLLSVGGEFVAGVNSSVRGILTLWDGSGGNQPGYLILYSPNGTANYIFCEDDGTLKIHTSAPTQNSDGSEIGGQSYYNRGMDGF